MVQSADRSGPDLGKRHRRRVGRSGAELAAAVSGDRGERAGALPRVPVAGQLREPQEQQELVRAELRPAPSLVQLGEEEVEVGISRRDRERAVRGVQGGDPTPGLEVRPRGHDVALAGVVQAAIGELPQNVQPRFTIIDSSGDLRREGLINLGIAATDSPFVTVLDDDDTWESSFLQRTASFLSRPENAQYVGVVAGSRIVFEKFVNGVLSEIERVDISHWMRALRLWQLLGSNLFPIHALLYRRGVETSLTQVHDRRQLADVQRVAPCPLEDRPTLR